MSCDLDIWRQYGVLVHRGTTVYVKVSKVIVKIKRKTRKTKSISSRSKFDIPEGIPWCG